MVGRYLNQAGVTAGKRFGTDKSLGILGGFTFDFNGHGFEDIEPSFDGCSTTYHDLQTREYMYNRPLWGLTGSVDKKLSNSSSVYLKGMFSELYDYSLWGEWFEAQSFIAASIPNMPVPGNHDLHRGPGIKEVLDTPPIWRQQFSLPHNGPEGIPELDQHSYYVDYEGVRFISLDVNVYANSDFAPSEKKRIAAGEAAWLEKILRDNPNHWTIVRQHQPIFAISKERDYEEMRKVLLPLYDKYHVDLVLQGHDHAYARSLPLVDGKPAAPNQRGTIYTVSVSGPKMYEARDDSKSLMKKEIRNTQMFQIIEVDPNRLKYQAFDIEGHLLDDLNLNKH